MAASLSTCLLAVLVTITLATRVSAGLTSSEKKELLKAHNHFRSNVYPLATDMVKLVRKKKKLSPVFHSV